MRHWWLSPGSFLSSFHFGKTQVWNRVGFEPPACAELQQAVEEADSDAVVPVDEHLSAGCTLHLHIVGATFSCGGSLLLVHRTTGLLQPIQSNLSD